MKIEDNQKSLNLYLWSLLFKVIDEGSFSRVATKRGLSRTQISRALSALEDEIGHDLLIRSVPNVKPTLYAIEARKRIEPLLKTMNAQLASLNEAGIGDYGNIRFGAMPGFMQSQIVPMLVDFQRSYPKITFDAIVDDDPHAFMKGQADIMVFYGPVQNPLLVQYWVEQVDFFPCASPRYLKKMGVPKTPEDLKNHSAIVYSGKVRSHCDILELNGLRKTYEFNSEIRFNNILSAKSAVLAGRGIILDLPLHHCFAEIMRGELVPLLDGWRITPLNHYIGCTQEAAKHKRIQVFIDWYIHRIREQEAEMKRVLQSKFGMMI